jgi:hypothetical protein
MIDRQTGQGIVDSVWRDEVAMQAWAADVRTRRQEAAARGVTCGEVSYREIVCADLHQVAQ